MLRAGIQYLPLPTASIVAEAAAAQPWHLSPRGAGFAAAANANASMRTQGHAHQPHCSELVSPRGLPRSWPACHGANRHRRRDQTQGRAFNFEVVFFKTTHGQALTPISSLKTGMRVASSAPLPPRCTALTDQPDRSACMTNKTTTTNNTNNKDQRRGVLRFGGAAHHDGSAWPWSIHRAMRARPSGNAARCGRLCGEIDPKEDRSAPERRHAARN